VTVSNVVSDTTAPTVSFTSPTNGSTVSGTVTSTVSASDNVGVTKVEISLDGTLKMTDNTSPYNYSFDSKTLTNASHTLSAKAYDSAGNTKTATITVTVNNPDTTAPTVPASLHSTATTATSVSLAWTVSTDSGTNATGVAKYNVLRNGVVVAQPTTTSYIDNGVVANTSYTYTVQAVDGAGNVSANSNAVTVKTPTVPDTTAPSIPTGLKAVAADVDQINLTWTASTDSGGSGLAGYNVYRGGTKLNSNPVTTTSFGDSTVIASTTYSYKVEAVDGAGNKSAQTSAVSVTTPSAKKGDLSGPNGTSDGVIDLRDISYVIREYGKTGSPADITGPSGTPDGVVDLRDISYLISNYGK
jgi:chitodextrinase